MKHILEILNNSPLNLCYNYQLGSFSISYEQEFLNTKGVEAVRPITVQELQAAYKRKHGDREPDEVMAEVLNEQNIPDHFDLKGPVFGSCSNSKPAEDCAVDPEGMEPTPAIDEGQENFILRSWIDQKTGFTHKIIRWTFNGDPNSAVDLENVYTVRGDYIGDAETAKFLHQRGIRPELASPDHTICSIGYCERENKWYGWSHRAIYGYGVGNSIKKGDCAYKPDTKEAFIEGLRRWHDDGISEKENIEITPTDKGAVVSYKYKNSELSYNNEEEFIPGKGEWQANTEQEARQMAVDFAESVSSIDSSTLISESKKVYSPAEYAWYTFQGRKTKEIDHHRSDVSISLDKGEKFGIYFNSKTGLVHFVESSALEYEFRVTPRTINNWLKKSKPFGGKIEGIRVQRGNGTHDQITRNKLVPKSEIGTVVDNHTGKKNRIQEVVVKKVPKLKEPEFDLYIGYFKPNAAVPKYMIVANRRLNQVKKSVKIKMDAAKNLGSKATFLKISSEHRLVQRALDKGFAYVSEAHLLILNKDSKKVKTPLPKIEIGVEDIELQERSKDKLKMTVPFFAGNEPAILKEIREQVIRDKKLSANMSVRGKNKSTVGLFQAKGLPYLELILPNVSNKTNVEAKAFIRRLEVQSRKKFKAKIVDTRIDGKPSKTVRVFVNVKPFKKAEDGKFAKALFKLVESGVINTRQSYMVPQYNEGKEEVDVVVNFEEIDYSIPAIRVKPTRANLPSFTTKVLHTIKGQKII